MRYSPYPGKPVQTKKLLKTQHYIWDKMHDIELPIVIFIQKIFVVHKTIKWWDFISKSGQSKPISWTPLLLYSLGFYEQAKSLSKTLIFFALLSSVGKLLMKRRRPGSYPEVFAVYCSSSSSFPSRHMIGTTIISHYTFYPPLRWILPCLMMIDRVVTGAHYPTDCIAGFLIGLLSLQISDYFEDHNLLLFLLLFAVEIWPSGGKILSGAFPIIVAPDVSISILCFPLIFLKLFFNKIFIKKDTEKKSLKEMTEMVLSSCLTTFIIVKVNALYQFILQNNDDIFKNY